MKEETVIYTDGKKVKITTHEFIVNRVKYLVKGIAAVRMRFIHYYKYAPLTLLFLGIAGIIMGITGVFDKVHLHAIHIGNFLLTANRFSVIIGLVMSSVSLFWLSVVNDKYAVVITTAEGDINPVTSKKKDYIHQIVAALKAALRFQKF